MRGCDAADCGEGCHPARSLVGEIGWGDRGEGGELCRGVVAELMWGK